jgi:hypothetical protein
MRMKPTVAIGRSLLDGIDNIDLILDRTPGVTPKT